MADWSNKKGDKFSGTKGGNHIHMSSDGKLLSATTGEKGGGTVAKKGGDHSYQRDFTRGQINKAAGTNFPKRDK